jgi:aldose 1-epimerase
MCAANTPHRAGIQVHSFGSTNAGDKADLYVLSNNLGMEVSISNFGATMVSLKVPDRKGKLDDVVLGFDSVREYEDGKAYFGATIGRYGNRIAHGKFELAGHSCTLSKNDGDNTLHGGSVGFNKKMWAVQDVSTKGALEVHFTYVSRDGEEGFPGNLTAKVAFRLPLDKNEIEIKYTATTDKLTVLNLTNHSYFNLTGQGDGDILGHNLQLHANKFTPVNATLIPTGVIQEVRGTPFDFTRSTPIGARIAETDERLKFGKGYDHNWLLDKKAEFQGLTLAGVAFEPKSGRVLEVLTDEVGIHFYSGNFLDGTVRRKEGKVYPFRSAFCLETQHFPDSPNHPNFPPATLTPGKTFHCTTLFRFSVK